MTIDMKKQYRTRDGREVRIYAVDGGGYKTVHGAILHPGEGWMGHWWGTDGTDGGTHDKDLVEVRPRIKREVWVNVFRQSDMDEYVCIYDNKSEADRDDAGRIACVKLVIDCEEGEGLDNG